ncbi:Lrp/AsnC family transcriptional regulator [Hyphococcus sp.]|jgi:DNA-binding Lrp family transcriptional regulator|uniref:Lrp/AsnC family transcriptional regulator n=1 Tax=Hyphococcus sp. TaxID=2038636 RepID=UPI003D0C2209
MIDFLGIKILRALCKDGRMSYACLAEKIHLSQTPTIKRVRRLEEDGYITGYSAILNENKLGGGMNIFVWVTLANQKISTHADFQKLVSETPQIMECFLTTGESDYLLRVAVETPAEFEKLLSEKISSVVPISHTKSSFALRSVKREMIPPHLAVHEPSVRA